LWDPLPAPVRYVSGSLTGTVDPPAVYSPTARAIVWGGTLPTSTAWTIRFQVTPGLTGTGSLELAPPVVNTAWLTDTHSGLGVSARALVNGRRTHLPLVLKQALTGDLPSGPDCSAVAINFSPSKATYQAGDAVDVAINGVGPTDGTVWLQWTRTSTNTQLDGAAWHTLDVVWNSVQSQYQATWIITDALPGFTPYHESKNQEFIIAFTLWDDIEGKYLCSGNPDPGAVEGHPELPAAMCDNCYEILVTRYEPSDALTNLADYWNVEPGYSFTYRGDRLDHPEKDNGEPASGDFVTRLEYEAPIELCDIPLIPQRWTKTNRWGYWGAARPKPQERRGDIWTEGNRNYRFFLTDPRYPYAWEDAIWGAYAHKIYEVAGDDYQLGDLSDILNRTISHTSRNHENYYYPPYLLSYAAIPNVGQETFVRIDSVYQHVADSADLQDVICQRQTPTEDHYWHTRARFLTDSDLKHEFNTIQGYFTDTKEIAVLTFFEGSPNSDGRPLLREDWYLMQDVGLVGVDQAKWNKEDTLTITTYFRATFMKEGTSAFPHVRIRADRGYIGDPLEITAIGPGTSFPMTVTAGSCYTVGVQSRTPIPMPYDGPMEHDGGSHPPTLWTRASDGDPHWAENGVVVECLPASFPSGAYQVRLRPFITPSPSDNETTLSFEAMPWSTNHLWIIVP
jgi:hypothetical protein